VNPVIDTVVMLLRYGLVLILIMVMLRAFLGPSAVDRIIAINYAVSLVVLLILLSSSYQQLTLYLDVALVFVLGAFVATVGVLRLLEEGKL
jgi:multisubunit Na+/H+ antiporter MnhF subunit